MKITVGELVGRFLEQCGVRAAFGLISIHNMPILDAFNSRGRIRFVSARGEAGACNMADAYARASGSLGVCITSTGTGCGNAAGAMVEALTAGTQLLHLTGQIESEFLDRDMGYIHEHSGQLAMLRSVSKAAFRIRNPETALATLREAVRVACTAPCGPVGIEIPIDVQKMLVDLPADLSPIEIAAQRPATALVDEMAERLRTTKRPLLWLGGGARAASPAAQRFADMGWAIVSSTHGRGILREDHPQSLGAFNQQKPVEKFYATCDVMLVAGSRLRSNETLNYRLELPARRFRIDADVLAENKSYGSELFIHGDAAITLNALADRLEGRMSMDPHFCKDVGAARTSAEALIDSTLGNYVKLKNGLNAVLKGQAWWVRDITLSNSMWGNRSLLLDGPRSGIHALGGGIGQGLAMGIGVSVANREFALGRKTVVLAGDGGFMLNIGELACAVQEKTDLVMIVMNDSCYGVIKNIQDDIYGGRNCFVELHTPDFGFFCKSLKVGHILLNDPADTDSVLKRALSTQGPMVVEVDMKAWGPFAAKFAGPPRKTR